MTLRACVACPRVFDGAINCPDCGEPGEPLTETPTGPVLEVCQRIGRPGPGSSPAARLLHIVIHDDPIGKGRPRVGMIAGQARAFTPAKTRKWEARAAAEVSSALPEGWTFPEAPLTLRVEAVFRRPGRLQCKHKRKPCRCDKDGLRGRHPHTSRPDGDNVLKALLDALEKGGAVKDDAIFQRIVIEKWYAAEDEAPSVTAEVDLRFRLETT